MLQSLNNISAYSSNPQYSTLSLGSVKTAESSSNSSTSISVKSQSKDEVSISDKAKQLSLFESQKKQIDEKTRDSKSDPVKSPLQQDKNSVETKDISIVEIDKYYPPFLSTIRRKEIIDKYPFFKDAIDRMTVPPPIEFTLETSNAFQNDINSVGGTVDKST